jgi:hypothetical protein
MASGFRAVQAGVREAKRGIEIPKRGCRRCQSRKNPNCSQMTQRKRRVKGEGEKEKEGAQVCEVWSGQKVAGTKWRKREERELGVGGVKPLEPNV